jgi:CheY-like chemotaxis protein
MPRSVLIVDDEPGLARVLAIRMKAAGFEARTADGGVAGLESARSAPPDAIVLDVRMPDMDGFEVQARLKADPALRDVPVVFVSANVQDSARHAALAAGAFAYLSKPYDAREVVAVVDSAIAARASAAPVG